MFTYWPTRPYSGMLLAAAVIVSGGAWAEVATNSPDTGDSSSMLEEVTVTAQKRSERLLDVPIAETVLDASSLAEAGQYNLSSYYTAVPGLNFDIGNRGEPIVAIRGIANIYGNPTIAIVVDDLPQGSAIGSGGGFTVPDLDPSDLQRVEVLKGPQGTLYGANSMGGLIKYVTVDPSPSALSGRVEAGGDSVVNGYGLGYHVRGAINVPLTDTLAVRVSGYTREEPGFIDNVISDQRGVNKTVAEGGRLALFWVPNETFSWKLSALDQQNDVHGYPTVEFALGDLKQNNIPNTGFFDTRNQAYSSTLTAKLGQATLTSLTGYGIYQFTTLGDLTAFYGSLAQSQFGVSGSTFPEALENRRFSQELRLALPLGSRIDWLLGGFYTHEKTAWTQITEAAVATTGMGVGVLDNSSLPSTYDGYSGFTNFEFHATDRLTLQLGGRESRDVQTYQQFDLGAFALDGGDVPKLRISEDFFTYSFSPQFKISPDLMAYARAATGFRPGGPNIPAPGVALPPKFAPDKTQNYELGLKGDSLLNIVSFDASLYYIDWKDIQLTLFQNGFTYYANGGSAKSEGLEVSSQVRPGGGLSINGWTAWNEAVLTQNLPASSTAYGMAGDRLPLASRLSGSLGLKQDFEVTARVAGFAGGTVSYVGGRLYQFDPTAQRTTYPAYAKVDADAGVKYETWTFNAYVNNLFDRRGEIGGGIGTTNPLAFTVIEPRTVGVWVAKTF
jgi:iron complex outermembrane recepter protein